MITRLDVQLTLEALNPETPASEVDALYSRIRDEKDQYQERAYMRMKTQHQKVKGTLPDWATDVAIRDRAAMEAENTVRGLYLEPLTAQITETELELEEQEAELTQELAMQNPRAWADYDLEMELPEAPNEFQEAMEIWPTQDGGWLGIASKRLAQAEYHDLPRPYEPDEMLAKTWEAEIQVVYDEMEARLSQRSWRKQK
ncbi:hypothetical protein [Corynebacterium variabile]|uniref:hypothetical protein n=1 Tax=Corynebacterium variabile TaxID=1727 RepID=UPI003BB12CE7